MSQELGTKQMYVSVHLQWHLTLNEFQYHWFMLYKYAHMLSILCLTAPVPDYIHHGAAYPDSRGLETRSSL